MITKQPVSRGYRLFLMILFEQPAFEQRQISCVQDAVIIHIDALCAFDPAGTQQIFRQCDCVSYSDGIGVS